MSFGFSSGERLAEAFQHPAKGYVDVFDTHRWQPLDTSISKQIYVDGKVSYRSACYMTIQHSI